VVQIIFTRSSNTVGESQEAAGAFMRDPGKIGIDRNGLIKLTQVVIETEHMAHVTLNLSGGLRPQSPRSTNADLPISRRDFCGDRPSCRLTRTRTSSNSADRTRGPERTPTVTENSPAKVEIAGVLIVIIIKESVAVRSNCFKILATGCLYASSAVNMMLDQNGRAGLNFRY